MSKWPLFVRGLIIGICGSALAVGGCLGALTNGDNPLGVMGAIGFVIGLLGFLAGGVMIVIAAFKGLFRLLSPTQEP